ncbi:xanthine dehydrogenase family protein molybdopterin-binding subunit [Ralstonia pseudosolanacearum]|uniref:xanthine dehydrogenase family protein molybdopterin-binding subunit n=1 Tax=Ralstonia pseudosolanacearum TaxID=1310165 RepID=UPI0026769C57|nr:xanthine dehydrogenase family protein molybdopterin-binding subunit [Ralstonia pseudosolanacearum]MDO3510058.1 xanthine dehydrogenase family protein molybdopterin-binding subunit [Ralstonia pseudosolanacearum]MDO3511800.1 xanthine dehydrogenase family protein molybdopterin-binding subunit [Ralstonia pseudosolanacearum]MDO3538603.1 xanthine dehydrogenase family protein molybdopterin-binding subunit [Ralstonia pseudosolanacearum]MDO3606562.1 xanthine dehydrogenase family protein molybdopterin-
MTNKTAHIENASRRNFLNGAMGLTLAIYLPGVAAATGAGKARSATAPALASFEPNAFVRVAADSTVTVISKHIEMGQGTYTGLATIVAEELDAAWSQVRVEGAPADAKRYNNLKFGPFQGTGGSTAIANSWEQLRQAGATARAMLVGAAAKQWQVPANEIRVEDGVVLHSRSGRKANFGQLARAAAQQPVPTDVKLKDPKDFKLIGKRAPRKDSADKTNGKARFTQDVHLPGMLTAMVAHPPRFGAKVKSFNATPAKAVQGVVDVVRIPTGVAVLAKDTWSARKGRDALQVEWDESAAFKLSSDEIFARYHELAKTPGSVARKEGDVDAAFTQPARVLRAAYDFPFLAHAAMEPLNCVVQLSPNACEIWNGEQFQSIDQTAVAALLGLKPEQVTLHMLYAGGSFGRRASKDADYVLEAVNVAKASNSRAPVKLVWTREDDMRGGYYRPAFHHALEAALDAQGRPIGWRHRLVGQSIVADTVFGGMIKDGVDPTSVEGAANLPYAIPALHVDLHTPHDIPVPSHWWRSVGSTHTAYSTETFIDELAIAAGQDPVAFRLALLQKHPRHAGALKLAADKAGWGQPLVPAADGAKRARGVAVHESFGTVVAEVAEVTIKPDGSFSVDRVVCAVDCGVVVNPDVVRAQVEGGVGYALSAALHGAITFKDGAVEQSNFHDYAPIRINEMPKVEVHIVPSAEHPTGIGEPGVPPLAPAVANAIAAATGKRVRSLPIRPEALTA